MARLRASEVLAKMLPAIHEAETTGKWAASNELEATSWRHRMVSEKFQRQMLRSAGLSKNLPCEEGVTFVGNQHFTEKDQPTHSHHLICALKDSENWIG